MTRSVLRRVATGLIGAVVFVLCVRYILLSFQWNKVLQVLSRVELAWWPIIALSILVYWMLRTLRWFVLLRNTQAKISLLDLYFSTSVSLSLALITPLQSGEMLKVELMKQRSQLDRSSGYGSFLIERVADLVVVVGLATISILSSVNLSLKVDQKTIVYGLSGLFLLVLVGWIVVMKTKLPRGIGEFLGQVRASAGNPKTLVLVFLLTVSSWAVVAIGWQLSLSSITIHLSLQQAFALVSITSLINIVSFVPGAIGVSEVSIAELLIRWQQDAGFAQAGALVLRCYGILIMLLGLAHYFVSKAWPRTPTHAVN